MKHKIQILDGCGREIKIIERTLKYKGLFKGNVNIPPLFCSYKGTSYSVAYDILEKRNKTYLDNFCIVVD